MNKVCPLMIIGSKRDKILNTPFGDKAFDATSFQCLGEQCAAFRKSFDTEFCGMVPAQEHGLIINGN